jgi:hypothetical protein
MNNPIEGIENQLQAVFQPVQPRADFVQKVQRRLTVEPAMAIEPVTRRYGAILILAGGLVSGALLLWIMRSLRS